MAYVTLHADKLQHNYQFLDDLFQSQHISWGVVTKVLCGHEAFLSVIMDLKTPEIFDSRIQNIIQAHKLDKTIKATYIKPPSSTDAEMVVQYTDMSLNSEFQTINLLSRAAYRLHKVHHIILMVEMGDLREGVMADRLEVLIKKVLMLPNIKLAGIGTNMKCLNGVEPTYDKLVQLVLHKKIIEEKLHIKIPLLSGGTSAMVPLLLKHQVPPGINHFRVGESLFFGNDLLSSQPIKGMKTGIFELFTEIIELGIKPKVPFGKMGVNMRGESAEINEQDQGSSSYRALIDIGTLDINPKFLQTTDPAIKIVGATSDIIVVDVGDNKQGYKVGDFLRWQLQYPGLVSLMNSVYVEKKLIPAKSSKPKPVVRRKKRPRPHREVA